MSSANKEADKRVSEVIVNRICNECNNLYSSIHCFEGTFSLQVKGRVTYALQKPLKELDWLQKEQFIVLLGVDEPSEWSNGFVLVPKTNGKVRLCLDLCFN